MRRRLICAVVGLALAVTTAQAATDKDKDAQHTGGTAKGAAVGALAGHEVGSGHAAAGAATGAAIGHHDKAKAIANTRTKALDPERRCGRRRGD
jgi:uncharacterized protein YcfJ